MEEVHLFSEAALVFDTLVHPAPAASLTAQ